MKFLFYYLVLVSLNAFLWVWFKKALHVHGFLKAKAENERLESEWMSLTKKNDELQKELSNLRSNLEKTITIYNITKQLCMTLDTERVFLNFTEELKKYIEVEECEFTRNPLTPGLYAEHIVLPLEIDKTTLGYLVARLSHKEDEEKFHILAQQFILGIKRAFLYQQVQELAITDGLTGVFSRRYFMERFKEEIERSSDFRYDFSCLMVDIDNFKNYNDSYGHLVGDAILKEVAKNIKENIRQIDLVGRYGGEEFCIILTETGRDQARFISERIRQAIEAKRIKVYDEDLKVTVSIGISTFPFDGKEIGTLVDNADSALYRAKQSGRNNVRAFGDSA